MNAPVDPSAAFWRAQGVARTMGLRLSEAMKVGRITESDYLALIATCCHCPHFGACIDWLGRHGAGACAAPEFCGNGRVFETLRRLN